MPMIPQERRRRVSIDNPLVSGSVISADWPARAAGESVVDGGAGGLAVEGEGEGAGAVAVAVEGARLPRPGIGARWPAAVSRLALPVPLALTRSVGAARGPEKPPPPPLPLPATAAVLPDPVFARAAAGAEDAEAAGARRVPVDAGGLRVLISRAVVAASRVPVSGKPEAVWKARSAALVLSVARPSARPGSKPRSFKTVCAH